METTGERTLAETVQDLREHRGWTQGQLAAYAGCSQGFISAIESGSRTKISASYLTKLARAFKVPIEALQGTQAPTHEEEVLGWQAKLAVIEAQARSTEAQRAKLQALGDILPDLEHRLLQAPPAEANRQLAALFDAIYLIDGEVSLIVW